MTRQLLDDYTRLLTLDTRACAALFARDAEFSSRMGSQELQFLGRHEIEGFLSHVPRQISFRAVSCESATPGERNGSRDVSTFSGEILVRPDGLPERVQSVRFEVVGGRFQRFHLWPAGEEAPLDLLAGARSGDA